MNTKIRKIIAYIFIITFLLCSTLLVFYTAGYRYDTKKGTITRTGSIVLDTEPTNARIYLNNKLLSIKTPDRVNNILPGKYFIKIEKNNHYVWEKKLSVLSQEATFAQDINLFFQSEPTILLENIVWWKYSPNKNFIIVAINEFEQQHFYLYNLSNGKKNLIFVNRNNSIEPTIIWSNQNDYLVFQTNTFSQIISTTYPPKTFNLNNANKNIHWDDKNGNILYYQISNSIYRLNFLTNENSNIFTLPEKVALKDYRIYEDKIFVIEKTNNKYFITFYPLDENKVSLRKTIELNGSNFRIAEIINQKIILINDLNNHLYLTDTSLDKVNFNEQNIVSYDVLPEKNLLLIQTAEELKFLQMDANPTNPKSLIRVSQGLTKAQWFKNPNYCFYIDNGKLKIIELDDRNGNQIINLVDEQIQDFSLSPKNEAVYYIQNGNLLYLPIKE